MFSPHQRFNKTMLTKNVLLGPAVLFTGVSSTASVGPSEKLVLGWSAKGCCAWGLGAPGEDRRKRRQD